MQFKNLDRVCLNMVAYQRSAPGRGEKIDVERILNCFADIPPANVKSALKSLHDQRFIEMSADRKNVFLRKKGIASVHNKITKPICVKTG